MMLVTLGAHLRNKLHGMLPILPRTQREGTTALMVIPGTLVAILEVITGAITREEVTMVGLGAPRQRYLEAAGLMVAPDRHTRTLDGNGCARLAHKHILVENWKLDHALSSDRMLYKALRGVYGNQ